MSTTEIVIIVVCLLVGYTVVDFFLNRRSKPQSDQQVTQGPGGGEPRWFEVLGIPESATADEITAAYRRKIAEYHPDKVAQMAVEIRELAERRSQQINAAYDDAMKSRP